ncbi:MAG: OmpH family outer membrane protein [Cytophagales bacterium]|nr:MAG: OmpH family outer membrane protein [Cytophagales bacterium]
MKKLFFVLFALTYYSFHADAQRFGYVDTQLIVEKMPEYAIAQSELDKMSEQWQKELEDKGKELSKMRLDFEAEKLLFTDDMKKQRMADLEAKEKEIRDFQTKIFGVEGLLFQKRVELMKPIQDKLAEAIAKVARKRKLSFIFDKAGDLSMVYSDPTHNYTEIVIEELGLKPKEKK